MYKKCTSNSYIYKKSAHTVQNLYKLQTEKNDVHNVLTIQNVYKF